MGSAAEARTGPPSRRDVLRMIGAAGLAVAAWPLLQACSGDDGEDSSGGATTAADGAILVKMGGPGGELAFFPDRLRIQPGQTVRWIVESAGHSATAYHPANHSDYQTRIPGGAEPFNSEILLEKGRTFEHTFQTPGTYHYYCIPHEGSGMVGAIVVGAPDAGGPASRPVQAEIGPAARKKLEDLMEWAKKP